MWHLPTAEHKGLLSYTLGSKGIGLLSGGFIKPEEKKLVSVAFSFGERDVLPGDLIIFFN